MSPVYLNTPSSSSFPLVELKEEQHLPLFLSPSEAATSVPGPSSSSFNASQDQRGSLLFREPKPHDHKVAQYRGRPSDQKPFSSSPCQPANGTTNDVHKCSSSKRSEYKLEKERSGGDGSAKCMPSKMRLMQKMVKTSDKPMKLTLKFQDQRYRINESSSPNNNNNNSTIRVCSDCNTTTTPLWRSGPRGPKSLCNACGIRQRKARRAAEAAAAAAENGMVMTNIESSPPTKTNKVHMINKEKKSRTSHIGQSKKLFKPPECLTDHQSPKKLCFKNLALSLSKNSAFQGVFSQDVEEAAILLMELSCGFVHS